MPRTDSASACGGSLLALSFCCCCCCKRSHSFPQWLPQVTLQPPAPKYPLSPRPYQYLLPFVSLLITILILVRGKFRVVLICISLIAKTVEYFLCCYVVGFGLGFFCLIFIVCFFALFYMCVSEHFIFKKNRLFSPTLHPNHISPLSTLLSSPTLLPSPQIHSPSVPSSEKCRSPRDGSQTGQKKMPQDKAKALIVRLDKATH